MRTRSKRYLALIILMLSTFLVLVSCDAITAQKISSTGSSGGRGNGRQGLLVIEVKRAVDSLVG